MSEEAVKERWIKHLETYPENMRYKVNAANCLALMNWAYVYGRQTKEEEFNKKLREFESGYINLYINGELNLYTLANLRRKILGAVLE